MCVRVCVIILEIKRNTKAEITFKRFHLNIYILHFQYIYIYIFPIYIYIYIYIYMCVCVCVCVYKKSRYGNFFP